MAGGCIRSTKDVKTELPHHPVRNDTIIAFFFAASKNNDNAKVSLVSFNISLQNCGLNYNSQSQLFSNLTTLVERRVTVVGRRRLISGRTESLETQNAVMFSLFTI